MYFRLNSDNWFLAIGQRFFSKISSKDLPMVCFVVTQHSESALSLCLRYSKTSCRRQLKNPRSTRRTRRKIIVGWQRPLHQTSDLRLQTSSWLKIILKIFVKIYTIGYFCRDSAKNKFLDLFSALTAPKIRASPMRSITNPSRKATYCCAFLSKILVKDYFCVAY